MVNRFIFFITLFSIFLAKLSAECLTSTIDVGEWVSPHFNLHSTETPTCESATFTIFYRELTDTHTSAWQKIPLAAGADTRTVPFSGEDGQRFQFRSAVTCGDESDHVALNSFDVFSDMTKALLISSAPGVTLSQSFGKDQPIEGRACGTFEFEWSDKSAELRDNDLVGVGFTEKAPTLDWSTYRYLDFYYWSDAPQGFTVQIAAASDEFEAHLDTLSQSGDKKGQWHYCVIDLDEAIPSRENRKTIQRFAFTTPTASLEFKKPYKLLLDGVHLWRNRNIVETQVDSTPPSAPTNLTVERTPTNLSWRWQPAVDEQSDIEGYSYVWTTHGMHQPPDEILTTEPAVTFRFLPPGSYSSYYMKVRARNRAGLWSDIIETTMGIEARKDDPTPAPIPTPATKE